MPSSVSSLPSLASLYGASGHMVDVIEFIYGIYIDILVQLIYIQQSVHVLYM